jgi:large subunit ribosomal protein L1
MNEAKAQVESRVYDIEEALELMAKLPKAKFDESVELHVKLGVDSKQADQQVRGTIVLPHGTGKSKKVLVLAKGDKAAAAEAAGADYVGDDDMIAKIAGEGWLVFDAVVVFSFKCPVGKLNYITGMFFSVLDWSYVYFKIFFINIYYF